MIRNEHWYTANGTRDYPLADNATATSSKGQRLPSDIVLDLNLRFPATLGHWAFLSAVSVTSSLVTLVFQAVDTLSDTTSFAPLAVISLPVASIITGRHYPLSGQVPGAGGWIVFGEGILTPFTGQFGPAAGAISRRAGRAYQPLPVTDIGLVNTQTPLTGIVRLLGQSPVQVVGETREIAGVVRTVGVVRLVQPIGVTGITGGEPENVFSQFIGACGARPESGNCAGGVPIEQISAAVPDCDGRLTISFSGCAIVGAITDGHGIMLDCGLSLANACGPSQVADADGKLPNDAL